VDWPIERSRRADLSAFDSLRVNDAQLAHVADADVRGDPIVQEPLALIPEIVHQPVPQARQNELAVTVQHP
jgi:hypothetical protein